jgi:hypothetical protein
MALDPEAGREEGLVMAAVAALVASVAVVAVVAVVADQLSDPVAEQVLDMDLG